MLLIAAHPDDETIGAGVLLSRYTNVRVVHVTDGSPTNPSDALAAGFCTREAYADARRKEAIAALETAGIREDRLTNLHFVDQEVAFHLKELSLAISALVRQSEAGIVLTHAYEGGHPDHDSVAFACHMAREMWNDRRLCLCEFTGYHAGPGGMETYQFLADGDHRTYTYELSAEERQFKISMMKKFTTQARTLQPFSLPEAEKFRVAPEYDFTRPPHEGKLFYENFPWGVDGKTWREMASQTLKEIIHP